MSRPKLAEWFGLEDRVALVTGASANGGIGHAVALGLAHAGAHVLVSDADGAAETAQEILRLLVADEAYAPCGIGAEIAAQVVDRGFDDLDAPVRRLNGFAHPYPLQPASREGGGAGRGRRRSSHP